MAIDRADHIPAIGSKAPDRIVAKPAADGTIDADSIIVIQCDKFVELEDACERAGFMADAFHQATVAEKYIGAVIDDGVARLIELVTEEFLGQRHTYRVGDALSKRASGRFNANRHADFGVSRGLAVHLPKALEFADGQVVARQVQQGVENHRGMTVREHKAISVGPMRVCRIVAQMSIPERNRHFGHPHRGTRMA